MKPRLNTAEEQLAAHIATLDAWLATFGPGRDTDDYSVTRVRALQAAAAAGPVSVDEAHRIWDDSGRYPGRYLLECNGCGERVCAVVTVGEEPDYESSTTNLCKACLLAALALFDETPPTVEKAP